MDGVLNIHKPSGMTSHDVVLALRRTLREKRIGHTGTLDPQATGVLVLCIGKATRIAQYLEAGEKEYRAVMRLGITTDTLDAAGRVLETRAYAPLTRARIETALRRFTGAIMQQPPVYSALKVNGVPSYKLARQGKAEPLKPRPVTIYDIALTALEDPFISFTVRCSKGVYVRTLCADIGEALGMGAHLTALTRTRSGRFIIEQSMAPDQLEAMAAAGRAEEALVPISASLADFPLLELGAAEAQRVQHGNQVPCPTFLNDRQGELVRLEDAPGTLLALARIAAGVLKPELVFS